MKRQFMAATAAGLMAATLLIGPALAQAIAQGLTAAPDTAIHVPVGAWIAASAQTAGVVLLAAITYGFRFLPASIAAVIKTSQTEQLLDKAIKFGINAVVGATDRMVIDANVGNVVVATAANKAIEWGPKSLIAWLGGEAGIRDRIIARLELHPDVGIATTGTLIQAVPKAASV